jgi:hypothetical protein
MKLAFFEKSEAIESIPTLIQVFMHYNAPAFRLVIYTLSLKSCFDIIVYEWMDYLNLLFSETVAALL